jgi:excisionase family DNA binding protein
VDAQSARERCLPGLSRSRLFELVQAREIPCYRIGRRILFDLDEIDSWIEAHRV